MSQFLRLVRVVPVVLAMLAALTGCNPPFEARHSALPEPMGASDLVAADMDETPPLSLEEWHTVDALVDRYHAQFEELRTQGFAPFARELRAEQGPRWQADEQLAARFDSKAQSLLAQAAALDDALCASLAEALPHRAAWAERARTRRAIDRAARVVAGSDDGGGGAGFTNLDVEVGALLSDPRAMGVEPGEVASVRAALEPLRAQYRQELALAAAALAEALLEFPSDRLRQLRSAGLPPELIDVYVRSSNRGGGDNEAILREAVSRAARRVNRARIAMDDLNDRTLDAWTAVLPQGCSDRLRGEAVSRRVEPDGPQALARWYAEVMEALPEVRDGRAPRTQQAIREARAAIEANSEHRYRLWKAGTLQPGDAPSQQDTQRSEALSKAARESLDAATRAMEKELKPETVQALRSLLGMNIGDARAALGDLVGRTQAARLMMRAPHAMFQPADSQEEPERPHQSFALKMLLGPLPTRDDFDRIAEVLGARPNDPILQELWSRYEESATALTESQDTSLRVIEKRIEEVGREAQDNPQAFERVVAEYLRALMTADEARGQLMLDTMENIAAGRGIGKDDPRMVVARTQLAVARAAVPWRKFQIPWLMGPLWMSQADVLRMAEALGPSEPLAQQAAIGVAVAYAPALEEAALRARMEGFEVLRDLVSLVLQLQRRMRDSGMSPEDMARIAEVQPLIRRARDAGMARTVVQLQFISSLGEVVGTERHRALCSAYAQETFPEFFEENDWYRAARDLARSVPAPPSGGADGDGPAPQVAASAQRWMDADADLVDRLLAWQTSTPDSARPINARAVRGDALADATLATLRTWRDEHALRLLRDAAVARGEPAYSRMAGVFRLVSRPPVAVNP